MGTSSTLRCSAFSRTFWVLRTHCFAFSLYIKVRMFGSGLDSNGYLVGTANTYSGINDPTLALKRRDDSWDPITLDYLAEDPSNDAGNVAYSAYRDRGAWAKTLFDRSKSHSDAASATKPMRQGKPVKPLLLPHLASSTQFDDSSFPTFSIELLAALYRFPQTHTSKLHTGTVTVPSGNALAGSPSPDIGSVFGGSQFGSFGRHDPNLCKDL